MSPQSCLAAVLCICGGVWLGTAKAENMTFRGLPWSMTEADFLRRNPAYRCADTEGGSKVAGDRLCTVSNSSCPVTREDCQNALFYGGVPLRAVNAYFYSD